MRDRIATYRVQFRGGMTFDRAVEIVPYLLRLGVSHLYASPLFAAVPGSEHGYDVVDYNRFDEDLGGRAAFERLSDALQDAGLGLMLDIVPNHMAASPDNPWWRECAEWGSEAPHARHFDINWSRRLTLPTLNAPVEAAIASGDLVLAADAERRGLTLRHGETAYPLAPSSYRLLIDSDAAFAQLARIAGDARPDIADAFHAQMREALGQLDLTRALGRIAADAALVARLHDAQVYELMDWREARRTLSYRRFFEIAGLVGTRVEDSAVFDDVHRLTLDLVRDGHVDALRIDHVDGLVDPAAYFRRLRTGVGPGTWIVVEKILEGEEQLRDWPVEGTTGYEFIASMADLLLPRAGTAELEAAYSDLAAWPQAAQRRDAAKRRIVVHNFESELARLVAMLVERTGEDEGAMREGLVALIVALPVYRTYGDAAGFSTADMEVLAPALSLAAEAAPAAAAVAAALFDPTASELRSRFQQLTGPVMAKAVEDTLFYRHTAILAYNEVGCDPVLPPARSLDVHARFADRGNRQPHGLNATATHDTKRGEDSRTRLYALSERPQAWIEGIGRWRGMAAAHIRRGVPEPENEWAIYQALAGIWPEGDDLPEAAALNALGERLAEYKLKALREAKLRTTWAESDVEYEATVGDYVAALLDPDNTAFQQDFHRTLAPFVRAGRVNALTQTLLKLTVPGVPDIYQGSETGDYSLVDPDNRRPVDFSAAERALAGADHRREGLGKMDVLATLLPLRRQHPRLFARGTYEPLPARGCDGGLWFAFLRREDGDRLVAIATMRGLGYLEAVECGTTASLALPEVGGGWRGVFSGAKFADGATLALPLDIGGRPIEVLIGI